MNGEPDQVEIRHGQWSASVRGQMSLLAVILALGIGGNHYAVKWALNGFGAAEQLKRLEAVQDIVAVTTREHETIARETRLLRCTLMIPQESRLDAARSNFDVCGYLDQLIWKRR
jgi:hypothetical protein